MLVLKVGSSVMLRRNLCPQLGLVNGTRGTILQFISGKELGTLREVEKIWVHFDVGKELIYDVERKSAEYESSRGIFKTRFQFPISLSYCVTTHRAQGVTASTVLIDLGEDTYQSSGLTYVALSRSRTLEGIHIINLGYSSLYCDKKAIDFYNRQRFENNLPLVKTFNQRCGNYGRIRVQKVFHVSLSYSKFVLTYF